MTRAELYADAIGDAVKSLGSVPSGHIYASVMGSMSLEQYNSAVRVLVDSKRVTLRGHVLSWIGGR